MFQKKYKGEDNNPVDETDHGHPHSWIILSIYDLLQVLISFPNVASGVRNVELYSIEHSALLND